MSASAKQRMPSPPGDDWEIVDVSQKERRDATPEQLMSCASGKYLDRGPALPTGAKATCHTCRKLSWNRGCSACKRTFHKGCYYAHKSTALSMLRCVDGAKFLDQDPRELQRTELLPLLDMVGMRDYAPMFIERGVNGRRELLTVTDDWLKKAGMGKVVHRRKLLVLLKGLDTQQTAANQRDVVLVRETPTTRIGLELQNTDGTVSVHNVVPESPAALCGLDRGTVVLRIDGKAVSSRVDFLAAIEGKQRFVLTIQAGEEVKRQPTPYESLYPEAKSGHVSKDDFEKLRLIGRGAFSDVFLVRSRKDKEVFVLKAVSKQKLLECEGDGRSAIYREQAVMKRAGWTRNKHLIQLHHTFQSRSQLFFVLEFCPGGDLYEYVGMKPETRLCEAEAQFYAAQLYLGLRALHQSSIIYRDLKPENVLLDQDGNAKLADFGLSRPLAWTSRAQTIVGKSLYEAPEIHQGSPYSYAVDYWSYGIVLLFLLTGVPEDEQRRLLDQRLLCKAGAISADAHGFIGSFVEKDDRMRLEGYVVGRQPWIKEHVEAAETGSHVNQHWVPPQGMLVDSAVQDMPGSHVGSLPVQITDTQQAMFRGFSYSELDRQCATGPAEVPPAALDCGEGVPINPVMPQHQPQSSPRHEDPVDLVPVCSETLSAYC
eukprot:TRINITY_DN938_c2_g2_i1.p1 TRINITY_DN938_c2_g2~~TRINITY_DN938_c2_g2_i1.p1  ORF type:complete len:654 (+),score=170.93 TRINITY_DN938_c2_g2_i1:171-2132(+)